MPEIAIFLARLRAPPLRLMAILAWLARGRRLRHERRHLEAMPDFMLKDIGISRSEIDYVATHGEARRP
ncbi:DUF1127 domain-containing protein [Mesorhizobium sp. BR1-1-9]|uniref:DUF1127 domain-containing protein n=1 Tax=unclassified Mesorhizobium TaxID=325217 RepID=UPI00112741DA|nr:MULTISPECIES: DUF1127 domain-containing protein [unclassified Mesorhizobium]MBZ9811963.1 DUF1127 domain-containing protein [Mesorhizobium sp. ESP-6-2]MBZ9873405.1 DUF1127 domain-containing protein [Mesorhizobium sp. BR1-1-9]MBZ9945189.1 DUF1127 domain-containing protein [Mesorhizobium sp. BR1-1-13]TPM28395.1 DUF1127 domain-containing protein [Mesorhizobium sp. B2-2-2]